MFDPRPLSRHRVTAKRMLVATLCALLSTLTACTSYLAQGPLGGSSISTDGRTARVDAQTRAMTKNGFGCGVGTTVERGQRSRPASATIQCSSIRIGGR